MNILYKIVVFALLSIGLEATSLKELINITLKNSSSIKAMNYLVRSKEQSFKSVSNIYSPTLNIGASYTKLDIDVPSNRVGSTAVGFAKFEMSLYDGGKNEAIKRQKRYEFDKSKFDKNAYTKELLRQVITLFFQIKNIEANLLAYNEKQKALMAELKRAKQKYDIKMVTLDEVLKFKSALEANRYLIEELKYQKIDMLKNISLLVGKNITKLDVAKLPDISHLKYQPSPHIKSLQSSLKSADENIKLAEMIKKPKIKLEDSISIYEYSDYNSNILKDLPDTQNQFTLTFSLNLYDTVSKHKKESAMLAKLSKKEELNFALSKEKTIFELSKRKLQTKLLKINSAKEALAAAKSVYKIIKTKYQNGIVDNIAYLDALSKTTTAKAEYLTSQNEYEIAKADYYFNSGRDYKEILKVIIRGAIN